MTPLLLLLSFLSVGERKVRDASPEIVHVSLQPENDFHTEPVDQLKFLQPV